VNFWQFLDKLLDRLPGWPDGRGVVGVAVFGLTIMLLWMIKADESLRHDEFFKNVALLIIGTGFINGVVAFAFAQNKGSADTAQRNAETLANQFNGPSGKPDDPVTVTEDEQK
jgi:hypothetical protein